MAPAIQKYPNEGRHSAWPYSPRDFQRQDPTSDLSFYSVPRFVTHIDDAAIASLRDYYAETLPKTGKILELCSSWVSHFPPDLERVAVRTAKDPAATQENGLHVTGFGMNELELGKNPVLSHRIIQDLNENPIIRSRPKENEVFDTALCVVSIDYLSKPVEVLSSVREHLKSSGAVHLVISNRCFPTKVIDRWLKVDEGERLSMVGDFLWFAGYRDIEIVTLSDGTGGGGFWNRRDPLWVVRGHNTGQKSSEAL